MATGKATATATTVTPAPSLSRTATIPTTATTAITPTTAADTARATAGSQGRHNGAMPRPKLTPRLGPVAVALTAYDIWRRLPPKQRKWLTAQARQHGPHLARQALEAQKNRRKR